MDTLLLWSFNLHLHTKCAFKAKNKGRVHKKKHKGRPVLSEDRGRKARWKTEGRGTKTHSSIPRLQPGRRHRHRQKPSMSSTSSGEAGGSVVPRAEAVITGLCKESSRKHETLQANSRSIWMLFENGGDASGCTAGIPRYGLMGQTVQTSLALHT